MIYGCCTGSWSFCVYLYREPYGLIKGVQSEHLDKSLLPGPCRYPYFCTCLCLVLVRLLVFFSLLRPLLIN